MGGPIVKKIGIVGGVGWASTVEYYTGICRLGEARHPGGDPSGIPSTPEMAIESLDLARAVSFMGIDGDEASWSRFDRYHHVALQRLEASGAECALMASNTPHHRFAEIVSGIGIPVINLFEVVARECARVGARQALVLGTALTMSSSRLREAFATNGVDATGPADEAARNSTIGLIARLQRGSHADAAARIGEIASAWLERRPATESLVCLACTELPLAFPGQKTLPIFEVAGVTYVNTTALHIGAAVEFAVSE